VWLLWKGVKLLRNRRELGTAENSAIEIVAAETSLAISTLTAFSTPFVDQVREALRRLRATEPELFQLPDLQQDIALIGRIAEGLGDATEDPINEESFPLWRRFTGQAKRALRFAYEEAERVGATMVSPEHLLLGLLYEDTTVAGQLLRRMEKSLPEIRGELQRHVEWEDLRFGGEIPMAAQTKQVIDGAYQEARNLNDQFIGTEHLLIGLMREGSTLAAHVLSLFEVSADKARTALLTMREEQTQEELETGIPVPRPEPKRELPFITEPRIGDKGVVRSVADRERVEVAMDALTFHELVDVYRAHDTHGYRHLVQGQQTMFLLPVGTQIKRLVPPANFVDEAVTAGGYYIRVLEGEYEGYAGWIFAENFARTGTDDAPFPPVIE